MTFDELREKYPRLGFAVYGLEPGKGVTLEIHDGDEVYTFRGRTAAAAIETAFPEATLDPEPPTPTNVFD